MYHKRVVWSHVHHYSFSETELPEQRVRPLSKSERTQNLIAAAYSVFTLYSYLTPHHCSEQPKCTAGYKTKSEQSSSSALTC